MRWMRRALVVPAVLALSSCSEKQDIFSPKGPVADKINNLQVPVFLAAGVVGLLVAFGLVFVIVKGDRRGDRDDDEEPQQILRNTLLELLWTFIPFIILVLVAFPTVITIIDI